jgi:putative hemolysin
MSVHFLTLQLAFLSLALLVPLQVHANSPLNPASQSCLDAGGTLRMGGASHSNRLLCKLPSGLVCERWALRRGECGSNKIAQAASNVDAIDKAASLRTQ